MAALGKTAVIDNPEVNDSPQPEAGLGGKMPNFR